MSFMGSGLDRVFGQVVSTRIKTLSNANLVVSSQIIIKERAALPVDLCRSETTLL